MLANIFPPCPCIELYNASSLDILNLWRMKGKITKEFEPYSKTPVHVLYEGGTSVMIIPNQDKQFLQLQNPLLLFQFILLNPKGFSIEINSRDTNHNKRKIFITTSITDKKSIGKISINNYPPNIWTNFLIDIGKLFSQIFKNCKLKYIDSMLITGNIKIRKIYSLRAKDVVLPKNIDLGKNLTVQNFYLFDYNLPFEKFNLNVIEPLIKKEPNLIGTPMRIKKPSSPLRTENHNNIYPLNEKTKKNIEFAKRIPDLTRLKNQINYDLKIKPNGINRNINKIFGFNAIEILGTNNNIKIPMIEMRKQRDNLYRKKERSYERNNPNFNNREINSKNFKNKSINPMYRNKYGHNILNEKKDNMNGINNFELDNNENNYDIEINNAINNINKIIFHNDTLYNYNGDAKNNLNRPKYISYGINSQASTNKSTGIKIQKTEIDDIQSPIIKSNIPINDNNIDNTNSNIENNNNNNKYANFEILLDSALSNNSKVQAQLYDSIEEESCLINNIINSTLIDKSKLDDKIIKIEPENNKGNILSNNDSNDELSILNSGFPEISNLINDETNNPDRPYTPPLSKLVPVNQSRNLGKAKILMEDKNLVRISLINPNNISYVKDLKNQEKLIYDEIKGCYYNPKTNVYYDIKN